MRLIEPGFEIVDQTFDLVPPPVEYQGWQVDQLINQMYRHIERCGRTCYKSLDKITDESAKPFVDRMIASKHYAMLEHGTVYLTVNVNAKGIDFATLVMFYGHNKYSELEHSFDNLTYYITTNLRVLVENHHLDDLQYMTPPTEFHVKRHTVRFTCNRQVSHEYVRHRVFSFAQESTRYCNYTKDKFGNELTFINPIWMERTSEARYELTQGLVDIEKRYFNLIREYGWHPQQAATILPNALKTELVMTGCEKDWKHFFDLRAEGVTGAPHPQAKQLAEPLMMEFIRRGWLK